MRRRPSSSCAEALAKRSGSRKPGTRTIESGVTRSLVAISSKLAYLTMKI